MTGPECYQEAQRLAAESYHEDRFEPPDVLLARAQVFATLAHAAAVIAGAASVMKPSELHEWRQATDPEYALQCAAEVTR